MALTRCILFISLLFQMLISRAEDLDSMLAMYPKAALAASNTDAYWNQIFTEKGLVFPPENLYIRVFKEEKDLEVWASNGQEAFTLIKDRKSVV